MKLPAVVAGQFYPGRPSVLSSLLDDYQARIHPQELPGPCVGLLLPHAGYPYSGEVASLGYLSCGDEYETVVVAGPSHYEAFRGTAVFAGESIQSPLGDLEADSEAARILMDFHLNIRVLPKVWAREHSTEVHFPLIQRFLPKARVLPLVTGQATEHDLGVLADALTHLRKKRNFLFVASSDLSHFPDYATAVAKDREFLQSVLAGDPEAVEKTDRKILAEGHGDFHCTHCGREPLQTLMRYALQQGAKKTSLLQYRNSGDVTNDRSRVVGYAAVAFCR